MSDRSLPVGDRDEIDIPRKGEKPSEFVERISAEHAPGAAMPPATCGCKARGWVCSHEPSGEERINRIFDGPGSEG